MIATISYKAVLLLVPVAGWVHYIYKFTSHTYQETHRLFEASYTPINNQFGETLLGASTIRAFGAQKYSMN